MSSLPSIISLAIWSKSAPVKSPGSPPLWINGSAYCLLIASSKVAHSSCSLEAVFTTWVVLLYSFPSWNMSSLIASAFGKRLTSTSSLSTFLVETIETTGTLLSKSRRVTCPSFVCSCGSLISSAVSVIAVSGILLALTSLLFIAGVQPESPIVAARAIKRPLNPFALMPSFLLPEKETSSRALSLAR